MRAVLVLALLALLVSASIGIRLQSRSHTAVADADDDDFDEDDDIDTADQDLESDGSFDDMDLGSEEFEDDENKYAHEASAAGSPLSQVAVNPALTGGKFLSVQFKGHCSHKRAQFSIKQKGRVFEVDFPRFRLRANETKSTRRACVVVVSVSPVSPACTSDLKLNFWSGGRVSTKVRTRKEFSLVINGQLAFNQTKSSMGQDLLSVARTVPFKSEFNKNNEVKVRTRFGLGRGKPRNFLQLFRIKGRINLQCE